MAKIDWLKAKIDFVDNNKETISSIAAKYNVARNTVSRRANKEGWYNSRHEVEQKVVTIVADEQAKKVTQATNRHIQIGQAFQGAAIKALKKRADGGLEYEPKDFNDARLAAITGVFMERKGLGLDEKNINIEANVDGRRMYIVLPQKIKPEIPKNGQ